MNNNTFIEKSLTDLSYQFALKIVKFVQNIQSEKKEYSLSKSVLRTGTAIGAILTEIHFLDNKAEAIEKLSFALSDTYKTKYWMTLLLTAKYITQQQFNTIMAECKELHNGLKNAIDKLKTDFV